ncbi:MAG: hypothetical protein IT286_03365 [Proteobacteria bacterium]|nr:hypothetical protein [Pseudomonadota bacterium]
MIQSAKKHHQTPSQKEFSAEFEGRTVVAQFKSKTVEVLEHMDTIPEDFSFLFGFKKNENGTLTVNGTYFGLVKQHHGQIHHSRLLGGKS